MKERLDFLKNNSDNKFYKSLLDQYEAKGSLSDKQWACVDRALEKLNKPVKTDDFSISVGETFEIKTWLAKRLQEDSGASFFFRNLRVTSVERETEKAYLLSVKFVSSIARSCHICGRALDDEISRATGIGPVCASKLGIDRPKLETADTTLKLIDTLCNDIGEIGPVWVPKSQIKRKNIA